MATRNFSLVHVPPGLPGAGDNIKVYFRNNVPQRPEVEVGALIREVVPVAPNQPYSPGVHYGVDETERQKYASELSYIDNTVERCFRVPVDDNTAHALKDQSRIRTIMWRDQPLSINLKEHRLAILMQQHGLSNWPSCTACDLSNNTASFMSCVSALT